MLAAEYALGTMPHGERALFTRRLIDDANLLARVEWWNEQLIPMSDEIVPVNAPASVLQDIEHRLFSSTTAKQPWWNSLGFWRGLSVASLFGFIVLGGIVANNQFNSKAPTAQLLMTQISGDASDVKVAALYDATSKTLKLNRTSGKAAINRDFELWVIAGDSPPVSLGVLPLNANVEIAVPAQLYEAFSAGAILAVSDEPTGGSPTGQPTGAVLATGEIVSI